jgi:hypothetical protein
MFLGSGEKYFGNGTFFSSFLLFGKFFLPLSLLDEMQFLMLTNKSCIECKRSDRMERGIVFLVDRVDRLRIEYIY